MESIYQYDEVPKSSIKASWKHCKEIFSASTFAAGWESLKNAIDALPLWALVTIATLSAILVFDSSLLVVPIAAGLGRFVAFGRDFVGEAALERDRDAGAERLVGLVLEGRREGAAEIAKDQVGCRPPQPVLVLEMIRDQWVMHAGSLRDVARRGAVEAVLGERLDSGIEEFVLRHDTALLLFACRLPGISFL